MIGESWSWLTTAAHWEGADGIAARTVEHLGYTFLALVIAAVLALPAGAVIGHTGRGSGFVAGVANVLRALPSLGLLVIFARRALDNLPISVALQAASIAVLVLLAVPPILTSTYAGIAATDPAVRDAAAGMGMTGSQVLLRVEVPVALPLIFSGLRSAYLQAVATATIAAFVSLGGLGRYVLDGLAQHDYPKMVGGAVLVALLAIVGDRVIAALAHLVMSPGITGRRWPGPRAASYPSSDPAATQPNGSEESLLAGRN
jgi:osmoprotectant transport system permease protein